MKILSWNVRGLGHPRTVRRLKNKLRHIKPQILFLIETKVTSKRMESIRRQCGFTCGIDVAAVGTSGGLSLGWKEGGNVSLKSFSKSHIDVEIENEEETGSWRLTGFYGEPVENERKKTWDLLKYLKRESSKPWLTIGDFNKILFSFEKKGGRIRDERQMNASRETLEYCKLYDLGFSGQWYTGKEVGWLTTTLGKDWTEVLQIWNSGTFFQNLRLATYNTVFQITVRSWLIQLGMKGY
ncbi:hypothetical protein V6Z11_D03G112200 [Gossypium hirsutum]